jgi:site-specific recombinase XerD
MCWDDNKSVIREYFLHTFGLNAKISENTLDVYGNQEDLNELVDFLEENELIYEHDGESIVIDLDEEMEFWESEFLN